MDWFNPVEWFAWLYGKVFQTHSYVGAGCVMAAFGLLGLILWIRGVDKYKEDQRKVTDPNPAALKNRPHQANRTTVVKVVNNFIAGTLMGSDDADECHAGKNPAGQPCGVWYVEERLNTYKNVGGNGLTNTHQQLVEGNQYLNTQPGNKLTIGGEDTIFRNNTVRKMDVEVSPEAHGALIHDNEFEGVRRCY